MKREDAGAIKDALDFAVREIADNIVDCDPDYTIHEARVVRAMYESFRKGGWAVQTEAKYPQENGGGNPPRCDLRVRFGKAEEAWIEVKTAWDIQDWGKEFRLETQLDRCRRDVDKLSSAPGQATRIFALFGFSDRDTQVTASKVFEKIVGLLSQEHIHVTDSQRLRWEGVERYVRAWAWVISRSDGDTDQEVAK